MGMEVISGHNERRVKKISIELRKSVGKYCSELTEALEDEKTVSIVLSALEGAIVVAVDVARHLSDRNVVILDQIRTDRVTVSSRVSENKKKRNKIVIHLVKPER
jgi:hypothetical protein